MKQIRMYLLAIVAVLVVSFGAAIFLRAPGAESPLPTPVETVIWVTVTPSPTVAPTQTAAPIETVAPTETPAPTEIPTVRPSPTATPDNQGPRSGEYYVIQPGDTLWNITRIVYGDPAAYWVIFEANPYLTNSSLIHGGNPLWIP